MIVIGSLAWYEIFVHLLHEHRNILIEEHDAGVLDGNALSRQFIRNSNLLDKLRKMARKRFPNDV